MDDECFRDSPIHCWLLMRANARSLGWAALTEVSQRATGMWGLKHSRNCLIQKLSNNNPLLCNDPTCVSRMMSARTYRPQQGMDQLPGTPLCNSSQRARMACYRGHRPLASLGISTCPDMWALSALSRTHSSEIPRSQSFRTRSADCLLDLESTSSNDILRDWTPKRSLTLNKVQALMGATPIATREILKSDLSSWARGAGIQ